MAVYRIRRTLENLHLKQISESTALVAEETNGLRLQFHSCPDPQLRRSNMLS